jgi:hypothetical protein
VNLPFVTGRRPFAQIVFADYVRVLVIGLVVLWLRRLEPEGVSLPLPSGEWVPVKREARNSCSEAIVGLEAQKMDDCR